MVTLGVVHGLYKVVTRLCEHVSATATYGGGKWRLPLGDTHLYYSHPTAMLLLFTNTHHVQPVAVYAIPFGYTKSQGRYEVSWEGVLLLSKI